MTEMRGLHTQQFRPSVRPSVLDTLVLCQNG